MSDSQYDDKQAGTYHADESDAKVCAEFWDHLVAAGLVVDDALAMQRQLQIREFLAARRAGREQAYTRFWRRV